MNNPLVHAAVDLGAIRNNIHTLKNLTPEGCRFMAVVKANAYGHGAVKVARTAIESGADWLGVARLEEALEIRNAGIKAPLLVFGYIHPEQAKEIVTHNLVATVYNVEMATALSRAADQLDAPITVHIKVDTGMGRVGMVVKENSRILEDITKICSLSSIRPQGIYTHFAAADDIEERTYTEEQIELFSGLLNDLKKRNIEFDIRHAANSAGIIGYKSAHFDMVRAGIAMYGCYPPNKQKGSKVRLQPAMTLKSIVTSVKDVPKGFCVSYGMTHKTGEATVLASVPMGYADGYSRAFSSNGFMLVKGQKAPIVGRVCMDQTMIDVGKIPGVQAGDEVILLGRQDEECLSAEFLARQINTINYEIVSALTARVGKTYSDSGSDTASG